MMQLTRFTLVAAAAFGNGALASSAPDIANEIRAGAAGFGAGAGAALFLDMRQSGKNLQTFSGALGGIKADAITETSDTQRPFTVSGDTFTDFADAAGRSCDNQKNNCAQAANADDNVGFTVGDCDTQNTQCKAAIATESGSVSSSTTSSSTSSSSSLSTTSASVASTTTSATLALVSQNAEFNFFCEV